jgi:uncharacterized membrane-anchored protein
MNKITLFITLFFLRTFAVSAQDLDSAQLLVKSIEQSLKYEKGTINLMPGEGKLKVPEGFEFLNKEQSMYVLSELWGNPKDSDIIGMLVPEHGGVLADKSWAFTISYDAMGYVEDDDAEDIDYDDMLKQMKQEFKDVNPQRIKEGYPPMEMIQWASAPFYDKDKHILHWAKEIKFGKDSLHTLNYNLRILGRKGIFLLNAIATVDALPVVKSNIDKIINSISFNQGAKYTDFDSDNDHVAEWTVGGLVAGKVLAKVGFFALLVKFWKLIALAVVGAGAAIRRFFKGKNKEEEAAPETDEEPKQLEE